MGRYLTAVIFLSAAAFVLWHNHTYIDRVLMLPGIDVMWPASARDPLRQGDISAGIFGVVGVIGLVRAIWGSINTNDSGY